LLRLVLYSSLQLVIISKNDIEKVIIRLLVTDVPVDNNLLKKLYGSR